MSDLFGKACKIFLHEMHLSEPLTSNEVRAISKIVEALRDDALAEMEDGWFLPAARLNDLQHASVARQITRCGQAHFTNLQIRINGEFETQQADWVKHMRPTARRDGMA